MTKQIEFDFSENGTSQTNDGAAGSGYNGICSANRYSTAPSGYHFWDYNGTSDYVRVPSGSAWQNPSTATHEWFFFYTTEAAAIMYLFAVGKGQSNLPTHRAWIDNVNNRIGFLRANSTNDLVKCRRWYTPTNSMVAGSPYQVAITMDYSNVANAPHIYINGVDQTLTPDHCAWGVTAWYSDASHSLYIGSCENGGYFLDMDLYLYRFYNTVLSGADVLTSYNTELPRFGGTVTLTYTPTMGFDDGAVTAVTGQLVEMTSPTISIHSNAPSLIMNQELTVSSPTISLGPIITPVPPDTRGRHVTLTDLVEETVTLIDTDSSEEIP